MIHTWMGWLGLMVLGYVVQWPLPMWVVVGSLGVCGAAGVLLRGRPKR